jgi:hypothetical protein
MRTLLVVLLLATPTFADQITVDALSGADLPLRQQVGIGNWLTAALWESPVITPRLDADARSLTNFTFWVNDTSATADLRYRTAVGVMNINGQWTGDVFTSDWQTAARRDGEQQIHTVIPGGLFLDPALNYLVYIQPEGSGFEVPGWTIQTTGTNTTAGVVGMEIFFFSPSHLVDLDLPHDRDVAMRATFSRVPEPASFSLLALGAIGLLVRRRT